MILLNRILKLIDLIDILLKIDTYFGRRRKETLVSLSGTPVENHCESMKHVIRNFVN